MVSDLVGDDEIDEYGEDYYGEETEYKGKVAEGSYDFMWCIETCLQSLCSKESE